MIVFKTKSLSSESFHIYNGTFEALLKRFADPTRSSYASGAEIQAMINQKCSELFNQFETDSTFCCFSEGQKSEIYFLLKKLKQQVWWLGEYALYLDEWKIIKERIPSSSDAHKNVKNGSKIFLNTIDKINQVYRELKFACDQAENSLNN